MSEETSPKSIAAHSPNLPGFLRATRWLWIAFGKTLFFLLGPLRIRNRRRIPKLGGVLILGNHLSDCDPVVIQLSCPRHVSFMAKSELFEMTFVGRFLRYWQAFPVKRGEPDRQALKHAIDLLKKGHVVGIFPEGQLSENGKLQSILPGMALVARQAGVPVVCCGLVGTDRVMPYGKVIPRPACSEVSANWGEPRVIDKSVETEEVVAWVESEFRALIREPNETS